MTVIAKTIIALAIVATALFVNVVLDYLQNKNLLALEVEVKRLKFHHEMLAEGYSCISFSDTGSTWIRAHYPEPESISVRVHSATRTTKTDTIYVPDASVKHSGGAVRIRLK